MTKVDKHMQICKTLNELYERKNADYGDAFAKSFAEYGLVMPCMRLEDKLNRLKTLRKQEAKVSNESIEDTLMDLANYAIMTLVEMSKGVPKKGLHSDECISWGCLCCTCANDNSGGTSGDELCCDRHNFDGCIVTDCPDYVKEE